VNHGVRHLAEGATDRPDPREGIVCGGTRRAVRGHSPAMDHSAIEQPLGRIAERDEVVIEETILQLDGVQEFEGVLERELVCVVPGCPVDRSF